MKLKHYTYIFFVLSSFYACNTIAAKTTYGTITEIKAFDSQAYISVEGINDPNQCGNSSRVRFYWTLAQADKLWSMLLAAQMSGKQVAFDGECVSGNLAIKQIYLKS